MKNNRELQLNQYNEFLNTNLSVTQTDKVMRFEELTKTLKCYTMKAWVSGFDDSFFWINSDGKWFFRYDADTNILWCSFVNVWNVFYTEFGLGYNGIFNILYPNLPLLDNDLLKKSGYSFNTKTNIKCGEDTDYIGELCRKLVNRVEHK